MTETKKILEISGRVNNYLSEYLDIHNDRLKFSLRRIIPIPGIFKAIDFGAHLNHADQIGQGLNATLDEIVHLAGRCEGIEQEFLKVLALYTEALIETIEKLKVVLGGLYAKSQGFKDSNYDWNNYKRDCSEYEKTIANYMAIGGKLNELFPRLRR